ncbi:hypothetical protein B0H15DRAFT_447122 [Mycena belliarum]|uniref:Uncharacterized protein n=1 Tax=Mycena belliarum TaxID=1033014 RepID=A0AAD6XKW9_9AGAR|nr:hypothetical protein B0H15DRAFT_447122 [Mycena belliae]
MRTKLGSHPSSTLSAYVEEVPTQRMPQDAPGFTAADSQSSIDAEYIETAPGDVLDDGQGQTESTMLPHYPQTCPSYPSRPSERALSFGDGQPSFLANACPADTFAVADENFDSCPHHHLPPSPHQPSPQWPARAHLHSVQTSFFPPSPSPNSSYLTPDWRSSGSETSSIGSSPALSPHRLSSSSPSHFLSELATFPVYSGESSGPYPRSRSSSRSRSHEATHHGGESREHHPAQPSAGSSIAGMDDMLDSLELNDNSAGPSPMSSKQSYHPGFAPYQAQFIPATSLFQVDTTWSDVRTQAYQQQPLPFLSGPETASTLSPISPFADLQSVQPQSHSFHHFSEDSDIGQSESLLPGSHAMSSSSSSAHFQGRPEGGAFGAGQSYSDISFPGASSPPLLYVHPVEDHDRNVVPRPISTQRPSDVSVKDFSTHASDSREDSESQPAVPFRLRVGTDATRRASGARRKNPNSGKYSCDICSSTFTAKHNLRSTSPGFLAMSYSYWPLDRSCQLTQLPQGIHMPEVRDQFCY